MRNVAVLLVVVCLVPFLLAQCQTKPGATGAECTNPSTCLSTICGADKKCAAINLVAKGAQCDGDYGCFVPTIACNKREKICGAGLYCKGYSYAFVSETLGTCESMPKIGEACTEKTTCIGSFCNNATSVCTAYRSLSSGAACTASFECKTNMKCENKVCAAAGKEGEACKDSFGCETGFVCSESKCVKLLSSGSACDEKTPCDANLFCDTESKKCTPFNTKAEGTACSVPYLQCQQGLTCKNQKCIKPSSNCTADACPAFSQVCECPATANGAGTCLGSSTGVSTYYNAIKEAFTGDRNYLWLICQQLALRPSGYVDPTILNLICTASASAIKANFLLLAGLVMLLVGLLY